MNARINLQILNIVNQDSGALGPLGIVIHQFSEPGAYHVAIHRQGRCVARTVFDVDPAGDRQIEIHLTAAGRQSLFLCDTPKVVPSGFVLFHASGGDGYSATVTSDSERTVFDSAKLSPGDLYATSLLEPGKYKLANAAGVARAEIEVKAAVDDVEPFYIDVTSKSFEPAKISLNSSQGLVFRVKQSARVVITRHHSPQPKQPLPWPDPA